MKKRKCEDRTRRSRTPTEDTKQFADDTKQLTDNTKQNKKRQKVYAVPHGSQFCKSGLGILRKGEVIP
ncbi:hypothetical protein T11_6718 [Trichinella zimbabwensis]|uniref:Uncharacterized protein n=1 Tax=Trichinella zimbabwensis TaxID=268475 RepID=A0A0V1I4W2_9BILA|nr:hypothetical protein T11_6718 [Trichinella zimbabwensis]